jgi:hypothetical protein
MVITATRSNAGANPHFQLWGETRHWGEMRKEGFTPCLLGRYLLTVGFGGTKAGCPSALALPAKDRMTPCLKLCFPPDSAPK